MITRKTMWDLTDALDDSLNEFTRNNPDLKIVSRTNMEDHTVTLTVKSVDPEEGK